MKAFLAHPSLQLDRGSRGGPLTELGDGVVVYSSHSTQTTPDTIEELRRILREQVSGK